MTGAGLSDNEDESDVEGDLGDNGKYVCSGVLKR